MTVQATNATKHLLVQKSRSDYRCHPPNAFLVVSITSGSAMMSSRNSTDVVSRVGDVTCRSMRSSGGIWKEYRLLMRDLCVRRSRFEHGHLRRITSDLRRLR